MTTKPKFKVYAPNNTKSIELNDDGTLTIEGIASTTNVDLEEEVVSEGTIESMSQQASLLNLHGDHHYGLFDGVIGSITESEKTNNGALHIKAIILAKYAQDIKEMLDIGINLGFSIGGIPQWEGREITDIKLLEISLTAMPANWDTFGTVQTTKGLFESNCISGACYNIKKEVMKMTDTNTPTNETLTKEDVKTLFNELMAEKEQTLSEDIINRITPDLEKIAQEIYEKNNPSDTDTDTDIDGADVSSNSNDAGSSKEFIDTVNKGIQENLTNVLESEEFQKSLIEKMFGKIDKNRNPNSTQQQIINENNKTNEETVGKTTFTSEEAANQFLKNMERKDPLFKILNQ